MENQPGRDGEFFPGNHGKKTPKSEGFQSYPHQKILSLEKGASVHGRNPANQLRLVRFQNHLHMFLYIPSGLFGIFPATVV